MTYPFFILRCTNGCCSISNYWARHEHICQVGNVQVIPSAPWSSYLFYISFISFHQTLKQLINQHYLHDFGCLMWGICRFDDVSSEPEDRYAKVKSWCRNIIFFIVCCMYLSPLPLSKKKDLVWIRIAKNGQCTVCLEPLCLTSLDNFFASFCAASNVFLHSIYTNQFLLHLLSIPFNN